MPNIKSITIFIDGNKQVYRSGEDVKGHWTIDVGEELSVRGVRLALRGAAYTRWDNDSPKKSDKIGYERIISKWTTVFGTKLGEKSSGSHILSAGIHKYKFNFRIPSYRLPSSYEGEYGAIRYWLYFEIDRPIFRFNINRMKTISILEDINVNDRQFMVPLKGKVEKKVSKAVILGNAGTVTFDVQTDRRAYCPGEKIFITLVAKNNTDRDLGPFKATLIQHVTFIADRDEKKITTHLQSVTGNPLNKGDTRKWTRQPLTVPAVPHTTMEGACQIIKVKYILKIVVDIPLLNGGDATATLPVTIGTIPLGHTTRSTGASNSFEIDASAAITHAQCTRGYGVFSEGEKHFPVTNYIPWCTYVPNFQQTASVSKQPTSKLKVSGKSSTSNAPPQHQPKTTPKAVLPTAPPIDIAPPSYDDVMEEYTTKQSTTDSICETGNPEANQSEAKGASSAQQTAAAKLKTQPEVLMVLRFPDKTVNKFRRILRDCPDLPRNYGQVVAIAPQVIVDSGSWPQRTSIALIMFPSHSVASEWYEQAVDVFMNNNIAFQDVVIMNMTEKLVSDKNLFSLKIILIKHGEAATQATSRMKEYSAKSKKLISPLRKDIGGVLLGAAKISNHLTGSWPDIGSFVVLSQWESLKHLWQYQGALEMDAYKDVISLFKEVYDVGLNITFQSEDISWLDLQEQPCLNQELNVMTEINCDDIESRGTEFNSDDIVENSDDSEQCETEVNSEDIESRETEFNTDDIVVNSDDSEQCETEVNSDDSESREIEVKSNGSVPHETELNCNESESRDKESNSGDSEIPGTRVNSDNSVPLTAEVDRI